MREKDDISENPRGTELKVQQQRERERGGRFIRVPGMAKTMLFVPAGKDEREAIERFTEKMNNRKKMWN